MDTKDDGQRPTSSQSGEGGIQIQAAGRRAQYRQCPHRGRVLRQHSVRIQVMVKNTPKARWTGRFTKVWECLTEAAAFQLGLDRPLRWTEVERKVGQEQ